MVSELRPLPVARKYYESTAKAYDEHRQGKKIFHSDQQVIEALLRGLVRPGSHVLDIACGTNRISSLVRELGGAYHGVDASADMVALARLKDPNSDYHVADARDIPLPAESFDVVTTIKFLKWVPDDTSLTQVLREIARVLRPGGHAILHQRILTRVRLSALQQVRRALSMMLHSAQRSHKKSETEPRTRDVEEGAFLDKCKETGLILKFLAQTNPFSAMLRVNRLDAFYVMERRA